MLPLTISKIKAELAAVSVTSFQARLPSSGLTCSKIKQSNVKATTKCK